ncbi:MAG: Maf family nucleotide pyrophosphatase [Bacteroidetes bacterium]|nr:Maf family nucleotide pyrophosphatase [Bacteroidota bacterium]
MLPSLFQPYRFILASQSPRRKYLFEGMGFTFENQVREIEETVPEGLTGSDIAVHLAKVKAAAFSHEELSPDIILITADTIVWHQDKLLGKPADEKEAFQMLKALSNSKHEVFTGVCLKSCHREHSFFDMSKVYFHPLSDDQIRLYVNEFKPFDKAGAYGVQEWIGYIGVDRITGSFYNVMGLPTAKLYHELENFLIKESGLR